MGGYHHGRAERLFLIRNRTKFRKGVYNDCKIQFSARKLVDKAEAGKEEERLLKSYFAKYGEPPPLNSLMPDKTDLLWCGTSVQKAHLEFLVFRIYLLAKSFPPKPMFQL